MSEHLLKFLLSDLKNVRVMCKGCKAVVEVGSGALEGIFRDNQCPICKRTFAAMYGIDRQIQASEFMTTLQNAIAMGKIFSNEITVEFTLPGE